jgi:hypothetical protein
VRRHVGAREMPSAGALFPGSGGPRSDARDRCATRAEGCVGSTRVLETSDPNPGVFACVVVTRAGLCRPRTAASCRCSFARRMTFFTTGGREPRWRFPPVNNPVTGQFPREARFAANPYPRLARLFAFSSPRPFFGQSADSREKYIQPVPGIGPRHTAVAPERDSPSHTCHTPRGVHCVPHRAKR